MNSLQPNCSWKKQRVLEYCSIPYHAFYCFLWIPRPLCWLSQGDQSMFWCCHLSTKIHSHQILETEGRIPVSLWDWTLSGRASDKRSVGQSSRCRGPGEEHKQPSFLACRSGFSKLGPYHPWPQEFGEDHVSSRLGLMWCCRFTDFAVKWFSGKWWVAGGLCERYGNREVCRGPTLAQLTLSGLKEP